MHKPATTPPPLAIDLACQRHLAHISDLAAAITHLPQFDQIYPALSDLLPRLLQAQLSGEMLAKSLHHAGSPPVQTPLLRGEEEDIAGDQTRTALMTWADNVGWDSRYLAPHDPIILDPMETIVRDSCQDLADLAAVIATIEHKWQRFQADSRRSIDWVEDVAFYHVHSPWRRFLPRYWGIIRSVHTAVDSER